MKNLRFNTALPIVRGLFWLYAVILLAATGFRIFDNVFWVDEAFTIRLAGMTVPQMLQTTAADMHPPLYYLFSQLLRFVLGSKGYVYHLTSFLPYVATVIFSCFWIRKKFGMIPAIITITMLTCMHQAVQYNVEVRMYALAALFVLLAYGQLYRILETGSASSYILFAVFSLAAAYTHYYALISVAFFYLTLLIVGIIRKGKVLHTVLLTCIATVIGYLPWFFTLLDSLNRVTDHWWLQGIPTMHDCLKCLFDQKWILAAFSLLLLLYYLYRLGILHLQISQEDTSVTLSLTKPKPPVASASAECVWILSGLLAVFGTIGVGLGISYAVRPLFLVRYLYPVTPVLYLIFGVCVDRMHWRRILCTLLTAVLILTSFSAWKMTVQKEQQQSSDTATVLQQVQPGETAEIVTNAAFVQIDTKGACVRSTILNYYFPDNAHILTQEVDSVFRSGNREIWVFWKNGSKNTFEQAAKAASYVQQSEFNSFFADAEYYIGQFIKIEE